MVCGIDCVSFGCFMMAVVALSLPEAMILKRILSVKLIAIFFSIVGFSILIVGYLLNY